MKDYIVVKTFEELETLIQMENPPKELRGKTIIVAPNGLKFVGKEDIARLSQVKEMIQEESLKLVDWFNRSVIGYPDAKERFLVSIKRKQITGEIPEGEIHE